MTDLTRRAALGALGTGAALASSPALAKVAARPSPDKRAAAALAQVAKELLAATAGLESCRPISSSTSC